MAPDHRREQGSPGIVRPTSDSRNYTHMELFVNPQMECSLCLASFYTFCSCFALFLPAFLALSRSFVLASAVFLARFVHVYLDFGISAQPETVIDISFMSGEFLMNLRSSFLLKCSRNHSSGRNDSSALRIREHVSNKTDSFSLLD